MLDVDASWRSAEILSRAQILLTVNAQSHARKPARESWPTIVRRSWPRSTSRQSRKGVSRNSPQALPIPPRNTIRSICVLRKSGVLISLTAEARVSSTQRRKSVVAHYCPAEVVQQYFETKPLREIRDLAGTAFYSAGHHR
jgi:hypothetical protein